MINSGSFGSILCVEFRISGIQVAMNSAAGGAFAARLYP